MPLLAIPNVSLTSSTEVGVFSLVIEGRGARVLDIHIDHEHGRSVLTCAAAPTQLVDGMVALAREALRVIDLTGHEGHHPRVGALDVCPFVPYEEPMEDAVTAAHQTAARIGALGVPVFLYGEAAPDRRALPEIRAGGLEGLIERIAGGITPDAGPTEVDPSKGVVCVGARGPLIAFNVWIDRPVEVARRVAAAARTSGSGIRALGLDVISHGASQVSTNLIEPEVTGIDAAFELVEKVAATHDAKPTATELVGLVAERFLPDPDATAARLLIEPGRSLESALKS